MLAAMSKTNFPSQWCIMKEKTNIAFGRPVPRISPTDVNSDKSRA